MINNEPATYENDENYPNANPIRRISLCKMQYNATTCNAAHHYATHIQHKHTTHNTRAIIITLNTHKMR